MITKEIFIEDLVEQLPKAITFLMEKNIRCLRCGEPIWGTLEEACREKGYVDKDIEGFVEELNSMTVK